MDQVFLNPDIIDDLGKRSLASSGNVARLSARSAGAVAAVGFSRWDDAGRIASDLAGIAEDLGAETIRLSAILAKVLLAIRVEELAAFGSSLARAVLEATNELLTELAVAGAATAGLVTGAMMAGATALTDAALSFGAAVTGLLVESVSALARLTGTIVSAGIDALSELGSKALGLAVTGGLALLAGGSMLAGLVVDGVQGALAFGASVAALGGQAAAALGRLASDVTRAAIDLTRVAPRFLVDRLVALALIPVADVAILLTAGRLGQDVAARLRNGTWTGLVGGGPLYHTMGWLAAKVNERYGGVGVDPVQIVKIGDGRYAVLIAGTEFGIGDPNGPVGAADSEFGIDNPYQQEVKARILALAAGEGRPIEVNLVGHSQGGNVAMWLSADQQVRDAVNVHSVTTYGATVTRSSLVTHVDAAYCGTSGGLRRFDDSQLGSTQYHNFEMAGDLVPGVFSDHEGTSYVYPDLSTVNWADAATNGAYWHGLQRYAGSPDLATGPDSELPFAIDDWVVQP